MLTSLPNDTIHWPMQEKQSNNSWSWKEFATRYWRPTRSTQNLAAKNRHALFWLLQRNVTKDLWSSQTLAQVIRVHLRSLCLVSPGSFRSKCQQDRSLTFVSSSQSLVVFPEITTKSVPSNHVTDCKILTPSARSVTTNPSATCRPTKKTKDPFKRGGGYSGE